MLYLFSYNTSEMPRDTKTFTKPSGAPGPVSVLSRLIIRALSSRTFLIIIFLWFIIQAIYFAITTRFGLPPDETYHYNFIQLFAQHFPSPFLSNQGSYNSLIESVHNPFFLYHYLLSWPYFFIKSWHDSYIILRLVNVALSAASLFLIYRISYKAKVSPLVRNLTVFMFANTLMFVFMSGVVNYDSLFILLSLTGVNLLLETYEKITAKNTLLLLLVLIAGSMTKPNFLAFGFIIFILFAFKVFADFHKSLAQFKKSFFDNKTTNLVLVVIFSLLSIVFIQRYVFNLVNYHQYSPSCTKVRTINECERNALYRRSVYIKGAGRHAATYNIVQYGRHWVPSMESRIYGIFTSSNQTVAQNEFIKLWIPFLSILFGVAIIRLIDKRDKLMIILLIVSLFYLAVLLYTNYSSYRASGRLDIAIQGRYALPVLPIIYLVGNYFTERLLRRQALVATYASLTVAVFAISGLPTYLHRSPDGWRKIAAQTTSPIAMNSINK